LWNSGSMAMLARGPILSHMNPVHTPTHHFRKLCFYESPFIQLRLFFLSCLGCPIGPKPPHWGFEITFRYTAIGRTPPGQWSARRRDLYLTTHNTHKRQTSMPPVGFEPTISEGHLRQTYALDRRNWYRHSGCLIGYILFRILWQKNIGIFYLSHAFYMPCISFILI